MLKKITIKRNLKNQNATALLVTILLAGAISVIAFGMTKIALSEIFIGTKGEEELGAYYAAQAGVEDALMRFKFYDKGNFEIPNGATQDSNRLVRIYINRNNRANKVSLVGAGNQPVLNPNDYVYDLKVWSKRTCPDEPGVCEYMLEKDKSITLDVSDVSNVTLTWQVTNANGTPLPISGSVDERRQTGLWYRLLDPNSSSPIRDFYTCLSLLDNSVANPDLPHCSPLRVGARNSFSTHNFKTLRLKAFLPASYNGIPGERLRIKVKIFSEANELIGQPEIFIESTGYYGTTAKKIKVTADRSTKMIIGVFDYVIYSGRLGSQLP